MSPVLTDEQITDLARPLMSILEEFYQNSENEQKFQEWLSERENDNENN